ncbi:MAG TPA: ABC transporter ATP-binding protein [Amycolatopsis sp.]|nr:ABC transporter ATP-binding protein [Amycolatopsis sp.]
MRLSATGITVRFGGLAALDGVGIAVDEASIVGPVGPNGAGKTTLFGVLSGLLRPQAGTVVFDGADVTRSSPQALARRGMARTFQHPELFPGLSVREHLSLAYRMRHQPRRVWTDAVTGGGFRGARRDESERIARLIGTLGLGAIADGPVLGLPLGLARLVEIGRALAREPSVLLLDEPSSGLDGGETEALAGVLVDLVRQRGVSLVFVEHDVDLVLRLSDRVFVLDFGRCIAEGTPAEIRVDPAVRAAYLGAEAGTAG